MTQTVLTGKYAHGLRIGQLAMKEVVAGLLGVNLVGTLRLVCKTVRAFEL
ncbi:MAG: hypothetical protein ACJAS2_001831 [Pseudohongiellaceae bacterium]